MNGLSIALTPVVPRDLMSAMGVGAFSQAGVGSNLQYSVANLTLSGADSANYYLSGGNTFSGFNGAITPATLTVTADSHARIYGVANPALTYGISGYVNGEYAVSAGVTGVPTVSTTGSVGSNVGTYAITTSANNLAAANYQFTYVDGSLTVNPRPITVTADNQDRTYGAANPNLTYRVAVDGVGASRGLYNSDALTGTLAAAASISTGVGTVAITQGTLTNANNSNYVITYNDGALTIGKATLTVTADNQSRVYGNANPTLTQTISGFLNGDNVSVVTGSANASTTATASTGVGTATLTAGNSGLSAANYNFNTLVDGTLSITARPITVAATGQSTTYGTALNLGTSAFAVSSGSLAAGDAISAVTLQYNGNATVPGTTDAGTYSNAIVSSAATGTGGFNTSNYAISYAAADLTVNKATLTVTADNQTRVYGNANPTLTQTISGFLNGDTVSVVSGSSNASTTATASTGVGTATLTASNSGMSAANYNFNTLVDGTLTITARPITVSAAGQSTTYGTALNLGTTAYTVDSGNLASGDAISAVTLKYNNMTMVPATTHAMTYSGGIVATEATGSGGFNSTNYAISYAPADLTVSPALLTLTGAKVYDDNGYFSFGQMILAGAKNGETLSLVAGSANTASTHVGNYAGISLSGLGIRVNAGNGLASDYSLPMTGTLSVMPATLTYTATPVVSVVGTLPNVDAGSLTGFVGNDTQTNATSGNLVFTTSATASSNPGTYAISGSGLTDNTGNYIFVQAAGNATALTVRPAPTAAIRSSTLIFRCVVGKDMEDDITSMDYGLCVANR